MKKITAVILVLAFLVVSVPYLQAPENDADVAEIRLSRVRLVSCRLSAVQLSGSFRFPLQRSRGNLPKTTETLITNPVKYTFARPVGDFDYGPASKRREQTVTCFYIRSVSADHHKQTENVRVAAWRPWGCSPSFVMVHVSLSEE